MTLYIGCAVWAHDDFKNSFYPAGTPNNERLRAYAERLTAVELNSSFYAVPPVTTIRKWVEETPETFRFSPKFPKTITHTAQLRNVDEQARAFIGNMREFGTRLGPLMLQLPPSFSPKRLPLLAEFLASMPRDLQIAVEVRHAEFFTEPGESALREVLVAGNAGRVLMDSRPALTSESPDAESAQERKPDVPLVTDPVQRYALVRYISSPVPEENEPYWDEWVPRLARWIDAGRDVYFYVHCPDERRSPGFAREVYARVRAVRPNLPSLPWESVTIEEDAPPPADAGPPEQLTLF